MGDTYTQLFVQIVFAVRGRVNFIGKEHRELVHRHVTAVMQNDGHKMLSVFCMPDHIHFLAGLNPAQSISDMVLDVKRASTNMLNEKGLFNGHFNWQKGFGAFSHSKSQVPDVINYILNQEAHHQQKTFRQEYHEFLDKFGIAYKEEYLFEFYE